MDNTSINTNKQQQFDSTNSVKFLLEQQKKAIDNFFEKADVHIFEQVAEHIVNCSGSVWTCGIGKSGAISSLFSDFLISMGINSRFLSPINALHGDIGIVNNKDVFILISKSGETEELRQLMPYIKHRGSFTVSLVCEPNSSLGRDCDIGVHIPLLFELCPFNMSPVTSSVLQLLFCTTIAIASMRKNNLSKEMYAMNHPGGTIGKRLCLRARDVMVTNFPSAQSSTTLREALVTMSQCGAVVVVDDDKKLLGMFTDGDLRRTLASNQSLDIVMGMPLTQLVKPNPKTTRPDTMAFDIRKMMQQLKIHQVIVLENDVVLGLIIERELTKIGI
eukprot:TRINITY_DN1008_c0_g1_i1.p1 TRINITY_DN1008_c0_g1~~TRINITY_DN1008_c0_g1_i1.p1  ORF type:complete len:332 (+),score=126.28 TRINITY_DN1008_c0_g1_i1:71-1066(+)